MLHGGFITADLEIRRRRDGSRRLRGRFPYNSKAVLSDGGGSAYATRAASRGGRPRKEQFAPGAFAYRLNLPPQEGDIHLLFGHDFNKPLASRATQTLTFSDTQDALSFEAIVTPQIADTSHGADALALIDAGLSVGISPGFRIPPARAVPADQAEKVTQEAYDPKRKMFGALIRTIYAALLYELSIVTRPAYQDATVEADDGNDSEGNGEDTTDQVAARDWTLTDSGLAVPKPHAFARWRL